MKCKKSGFLFWYHSSQVIVLWLVKEQSMEERALFSVRWETAEIGDYIIILYTQAWGQQSGEKLLNFELAAGRFVIIVMFKQPDYLQLQEKYQKWHNIYKTHVEIKIIEIYAQFPDFIY